MKIKFLNTCMDKHTYELYEKDMEKEFDEERALEIIATGYAEIIQEFAEIIQEFAENVQKDELNVQKSEHFEKDKLTIKQEDDEAYAKLLSLTKKELVAMAKEKDVPHSGTKEEIANRLHLLRIINAKHGILEWFKE